VSAETFDPSRPCKSRPYHRYSHSSILKHQGGVTAYIHLTWVHGRGKASYLSMHEDRPSPLAPSRRVHLFLVLPLDLSVAYTFQTPTPEQAHIRHGVIYIWKPHAFAYSDTCLLLCLRKITLADEEICQTQHDGPAMYKHFCVSKPAGKHGMRASSKHFLPVMRRPPV